MTFDEYLTYLAKNNVSQLEMAKQMYDREILISKLRQEISDLKAELEESRACEDPVLASMNRFRKVLPKEDMVSIIAESERKFGIPLEEEGDKDER